MESVNRFRCLLYYKYIKIEDVKCCVEEHKERCEQWGLRGRIRISPEGINGTLDGLEANVAEYIAWMDAHSVFSGPNEGGISPSSSIHWKYGWCSPEQRLPSLSVKSAKEVVSLDLSPEVDRAVLSVPGGEHLSPEDFHAQLKQYADGTGRGGDSRGSVWLWWGHKLGWGHTS